MPTVNVTQQHIWEGRPLTCSGCPVSLAVRDALGADCLPQVDRHTIDVQVGGRRLIFPTPPEVVSFILRYDGGQAVAPFSFELEDERA